MARGIRVERYHQNPLGRDYVVGDIHGMYYTLMKLLHQAGFDEEKDRLFSVGDMVDRGPMSIEVLRLLKQPWFHAVKGNHEDMLLYCHLNPKNASALGNYLLNGGAWYVGGDRPLQVEAAHLCSTLPDVIEVETKDGYIGICHAEVPYGCDNWADLIKGPPDEQIFWGRDRLRNQVRKHVNGIQHVYHGHTPVAEPRTQANQTWLDTGCCFGRKLTMIELGVGTVYEQDED